MLEVCNSINNIPKDQFLKLENDNPFLSYDFLWSLENSDCVNENVGWITNHIIHRDDEGKLDAFTPTYLKYNSFGEFIFDHAWADFYNKINVQYYPKLLVGIPFTPVRSSKFLVRKNETVKKLNIVRDIKKILESNNISSAHINFILGDDIKILNGENFIRRKSKQFIWENNNYISFNEFLDCLTSRKRKMIKKERQYINEEGIVVECLEGKEITPDLIELFYQFYLDTNYRKWGNVYLNFDFFKNIITRMPSNILLVVAKKNNEIIATSLHIKSDKVLYGRYWGANNYYKYLHYELCYYQAIEYAIKNKLNFVEAGAGGAHKISRGYSPTYTYSAHYFANEKIHSLISDYVDREGDYIDEEIDYLSKFKPFKSTE
ncbi:MAG: GNAT family N-acetyltransferase [Hyphomicrobiales bacterium]